MKAGMRIDYFLGMILSIGLLAPAAALSASPAKETSEAAAPATVSPGLKYFPDPAYKRLNKDDPPPMSEMVELANQGDTRAMFILGDMSEKGKGGLPQDRKQARTWFEESAMHGYSQSFVRLAAMARHDKNPKEAWQWYTLAINSFDDGGAQDYAISARKELVTAAGLTSEDISQARKAIDDWKDARDKHLRAAKEAAAEKERLQEEQAKKDARALKDQAEKEKAQEDAAAEKDKAQKESTEEENAADDAVKTAAHDEKGKKQDQQEKDDEQN